MRKQSEREQIDQYAKRKLYEHELRAAALEIMKQPGMTADRALGEARELLQGCANEAQRRFPGPDVARGSELS